MREVRSSFRGFGSDNHSGIHPKVLAALAEASQGHVRAYGEDPYSDEASCAFQEHFGRDVKVFFTSTGTSANILALFSVLEPYECVLAGDVSHLVHHECGGFERITGCRAVPVRTRNGKLTVRGPGGALG